MVARLVATLDLPLRQHNELLVAAVSLRLGAKPARLTGASARA
jgi:hypothetical protein